MEHFYRINSKGQNKTTKIYKKLTLSIIADKDYKILISV